MRQRFAKADNSHSGRVRSTRTIVAGSIGDTATTTSRDGKKHNALRRMKPAEGVDVSLAHPRAKRHNLRTTSALTTDCLHANLSHVHEHNRSWTAGSSTVTHVPFPGALRILRIPLNTAARCRIPSSPKQPSEPCLGAKPTPRSSTLSRSRPSFTVNRTSAVCDRLCRMTFVRHSCAMRRTVLCNMAATRSQLPDQ